MNDTQVAQLAAEYIAADWEPDRYYRDLNLIEFGNKLLEYGYAEGRKDEAEQNCCPSCGGSGTIEAATNEGPDAHTVSINCPDCEGKQGLLDAYHGLRKQLAKQHEKYIDLCGQIAFRSHPSHKAEFKAGWLDCRATMANFVEPNHPGIAMSIRANWKPSLGDDPEPLQTKASA